MTDKTVAKRYAKALFAIGEEQGKTEVFAANIKELKQLIEENEDIRHMLENQSIESMPKKNAMKTILADVDDMVKNFVCLVLDKDRGAFFSDMCEAYETLLEEAANTVLAKVTSAVPLTDGQLQQIEDKFSAIVNQKVKARAEVDASLIGGVQVMIGDKLYDGTLAHQIKQLSDKLKQKEMLS